MLQRKVERKLESWRATKTTQGLIVTGARQVGKTSSIEAFARKHYAHLAKIDFVERPEAVEILTAARGTDDLIRRITALGTEPLVPGQTLLFLDEVQRCKNSIDWIKYLVQDGCFDVVYSGSQLGIEAFDYRSLPVGYADVVDMFPLDFQEFCWAFGLAEELWDEVRDLIARRQEIPDYLHDRFMRLFNLYVLVGGMPEAVQVYADTNDTPRMRAAQQRVLSLYRADITRYVDDPVHAQRIRTIFDAVPAQLNKENKRFIVTSVNKKKRHEDLVPDFDWLANAGVVLPCRKATQPTFPIGLELEISSFKLYQSDVGLLFSTLSQADVLSILASDANINYGSIYENAVAQELRAHGHRLAYYHTHKYGEVDFLLEGSDPAVTLVEVKSGKQSHRHKALDNLMAVPTYSIGGATVLHPYNTYVDGRVTYLPIYACSLL